MIEELLKRRKRDLKLAALTGAGISAESGIPTFRGEEGLWKRYRPEELATPEAFARNPALVWEWYDWRRQIIARSKPNPAHRTLAEMEEAFPHFTLITQNVDGLHQAAGSKRVLELHGNIWRVRCVKEGIVMENREVPLREIPPRCPCGALLRPDVVWFGEALPSDVLEEAFRAAGECEIMLVIGTSAVVQPAASIPLVAFRRGAAIVEINPQETPLSPYATETVRGKAGETLPLLWEKWRSIIGF
ncbi:MAG: NAD-dependent deacylase [Anaerolineae bacterium]|nr:NAD-dependent deacylase [Anaerolineae bacterium]MDW8101986.1 NAD-dependent deacylase [Anaerolineae bacterium]